MQAGSMPAQACAPAREGQELMAQLMLQPATHHTVTLHIHNLIHLTYPCSAPQTVKLPTYLPADLTPVHTCPNLVVPHVPFTQMCHMFALCSDLSHLCPAYRLRLCPRRHAVSRRHLSNPQPGRHLLH